MLHAVEPHEAMHRAAAPVRPTRWPWIQNRSLFLIPCSSKKISERARAKDLYRSPRFGKQIKAIQSIGAEYRIFSSKHGLVEPNLVIDHYDTPLSSLSAEQIENLFERSVFTLTKIRDAENVKRIIILNTEGNSEGVTYNALMRRIAEEVCSDVISVSDTQSSDLASESSNLFRRKKYVTSFYEQSGFFSNLRGPFSFSTLPTADLPKAGVYVFTDEREWSAVAGNYGRIVRIGTHGVSEGSKATLVQRLRAHYGLSNGGGNHRSSIFRLHVGACLQLSGAFQNHVPSWQGVLPRDPGLRQIEDSLEMAVSQYIRSLTLWWVEIAGPAHKNSRRSIVESGFIRNLTGDGLVLDGPSNNWLGRFSTRPAIANSGLWNVQHVGNSSQKKVNQLEFSF